MTGRRTLSLALASGACTVCVGARRVHLLVLGYPQDFGPVGCPQHFVATCLLVPHIPVRRDTPKRSA